MISREVFTIFSIGDVLRSFAQSIEIKSKNLQQAAEVLLGSSSLLQSYLHVCSRSIVVSSIGFDPDRL